MTTTQSSAVAAVVASPLPLAGRVAIVTGASHGIGRGIAIHLASLGADVIIGYSSSPAPAADVAAQINSSSPSSPRAVAVQADVSDPSAVHALFEASKSSFGREAHIIVACAGIMDSKSPRVADTATESWDSIFAVNARGAFLCCREAANRLPRDGGGRIIAVTSSLVASLLPGYAAYAASKAAVEAMVKIMAKELKGTRITANCVAPGPVATKLYFAGRSEEEVKRTAENNPMGRIGEVEDIAPVVGFVCTDAAEWLNGQVVRVNGGYVS